MIEWDGNQYYLLQISRVFEHSLTGGEEQGVWIEAKLMVVFQNFAPLNIFWHESLGVEPLELAGTVIW